MAGNGIDHCPVGATLAPRGGGGAGEEAEEQPMTAKDFEGLARVMKMSRLEMGTQSDCQWLECIRRLCDYFDKQNPRFDRGRFLAACRKEDSNG